MRSKTLLTIALVVGAILFLPRLLAMRSKPAAPPDVAQPPPPSPPQQGKRKKTILGRIVQGTTELLGQVSHPSAQNVAQGLGVFGSFTK